MRTVEDQRAPDPVVTGGRTPASCSEALGLTRPRRGVDESEWWKLRERRWRALNAPRATARSCRSKADVTQVELDVRNMRR